MQETPETRVRSLSAKEPLEEEMTTTPVFLPGESHGRRSLADYSPQRHKELDKSEVTPERVIDFSGNYEDYLRSKGIE